MPQKVSTTVSTLVCQLFEKSSFVLRKSQWTFYHISRHYDQIKPDTLGFGVQPIGYFSFSMKWPIEKVCRFTASQQGLGYSICPRIWWPVSVGYFFQSIAGWWASSVNKLQASRASFLQFSLEFCCWDHQ